MSQDSFEQDTQSTNLEQAQQLTPYKSRRDKPYIHSPSEPSQSPERLTDFITPHTVKTQHKTELQKLQEDTLSHLNIDIDYLQSGVRRLRSSRTLFMSEEDKIRKEIEAEQEKHRLYDQEYDLRPK